MQWSKIQYLFPFLLIYTLVAGVIAIVLLPLLSIDLQSIFIVSIVLSYTFGALTLPLYELMRYSEYVRLSLQKIISYKIILLIVFIIIWAILSILILLLIFSFEELNILTPFSPMLFLLAIIGYGITVKYFLKKLSLIPQDDNEEIQEIHDEIKTPQTCLERISVKTKQQINLISVTDIIYLEARGDYVKIYTEKTGYLKEQTIKYFEDNLPPYQFVRIHRSCIVNVHYISRIERCDKQSHHLILKNGIIIKTSIGGFRLLKQILNL